MSTSNFELKTPEDIFIYLSYPLFNSAEIGKIISRPTVYISNLSSKKFGLRSLSLDYYLRPGDQWNELKLVEKTSIQEKGSTRSYWWCVCQCGKDFFVRSSDIIYQKCCKKCSTLKQRKGTDYLTGEWYSDLKRKAKERNIEFSDGLTLEYLDNLLKEQNYCCNLTGLKLKCPMERKYKTKKTYSLDRIDSKKGYVEGNVQFTHKYINMMKQQYTQAVFIKLCQLVAKHNQKEEKING